MENPDIKRMDEVFNNPDKIKELRLDREYKDKHRVQRVKICCYELLKGYSPTQIADKFKDEWSLEISTIKAYCRAARRILVKEIITEDSQIREDLIAKYSYLYQLAMERGHFKEARMVLDSVMKLTQYLRLDIVTQGNPINQIEIIERQAPNED